MNNYHNYLLERGLSSISNLFEKKDITVLDGFFLTRQLKEEIYNSPLSSILKDMLFKNSSVVRVRIRSIDPYHNEISILDSNDEILLKKDILSDNQKDMDLLFYYIEHSQSRNQIKVLIEDNFE